MGMYSVIFCTRYEIFV